MWWRVPLDQFHADKNGSRAQVPLPQVLPLPATMAQPIDRHPAQTWVRFFAEFSSGADGNPDRRT